MLGNLVYSFGNIPVHYRTDYIVTENIPGGRASFPGSARKQFILPEISSWYKRSIFSFFRASEAFAEILDSFK